MNKIFLILIAFLFIACEEEKLSLNKQAPKLFASNTKNEKIKLERKGIELVEFWQNGCVACLKVMGELDEFASKHNIKIYAINSIDDMKIIKKHEIENNYKNIIFLQDKENISWHRYEIFAVPTLFILKDGIYMDKILGDRGFNFIKERIKKVL